MRLMLECVAANVLISFWLQFLAARGAITTKAISAGFCLCGTPSRHTVGLFMILKVPTSTRTFAIKQNPVETFSIHLNLGLTYLSKRHQRASFIA